MRSVVFAYHEIGYVSLQELLRAGAQVAAVFTHEDDPNEGRWFRSVRELARAHRVSVHAPESVNGAEWVQSVRALQPDFIFSFYYRKILSKEMIDIPRRGALNLHGSLLPKYRGRSPLNWVLIHDEHETGVTLHYMQEKPDRGDIVAQRAVPITDDDTALTLLHKLTDASAVLVRDTYPLLCAGTAPRQPQDHAQASYFGGRRPDDGRIEWPRSDREIFNLVRAVTHPWPGAFTHWEGRKLYMWETRLLPGSCRVEAAAGTVIATAPELRVQTGDFPIELVRVQFEGDAEIAGARVADLYPITRGLRLT